MRNHYLGILPPEHPVQGLLTSGEGGLTFDPGCAFDVFALDDTGVVFRYVDRASARSVVAKYYGRKWIFGAQSGHLQLRAELMHAEFDKLAAARALGFQRPPYTVVRPIATSEAASCVLLEDYAPGPDLDAFIFGAMVHGLGHELRRRLAIVAQFLGELHERTRRTESVAKRTPLMYLNQILNELQNWDVIAARERQHFASLLQQWSQRNPWRQVKNVTVHGDATPTNFVFPGADDLAVIDLERFGPGDCAADLGRVAAELKHLCWWYGHDRWASEPFIVHLYAAYQSGRALSAAAMRSVTDRGRFYMGCDLLRISRNAWLDLDYRRLLVEEAKKCLTN
jgi:aminoglycoside phosphotransferase (APT) family kinase protein